MNIIRLTIKLSILIGFWIIAPGIFHGDILFTIRGVICAAAGLVSVFDVLERQA